MEAIILAGGFGTRLQSVVSDVPKPMATISGRPFLEILLKSLAEKGFSRVVLSLGYKAEMIRSHFGSNFLGQDLVYVEEKIPLGTGGATRLAATACTQSNMFVFNGDTFLELEIKKLKQQLQKNRNPIVVAKAVPDASRYGQLVWDGVKITGFSEKNVSGPGLINAGCYALQADALREFPLYQPFSLETDYFVPKILRETVEIFITKGMFIDIGIPEDYLKAQTLLAEQ